MIEILRHVDHTGTRWMRQAACQGMPVALFFADDHDNYSTAAKMACAACPVQTECLQYAVTHNIKDGLWGGLPPKRRRGRRYASYTHAQLITGQRVRSAPLATHWKQLTARPTVAYIADLVDTNGRIDDTSISRILNGRTETVDTVLAYRIARALGASPAKLWPT